MCHDHSSRTARAILGGVCHYRCKLCIYKIVDNTIGMEETRSKSVWFILPDANRKGELSKKAGKQCFIGCCLQKKG